MQKGLLSIIIGIAAMAYKVYSTKTNDIGSLIIHGAMIAVGSYVAFYAAESIFGLNVDRLTKELNMLKKGKAPF
jgi:hypothetical protein